MCSRIHPEDLETIARLVVDLVAEPARAGWVNTARAAEILGISQGWVRSNAGALGGSRLTDGPRGELRFPVARLHEYMKAREVARPPRATRSRRPGPKRRGRIELLPIPADAV